MIEHVHIRGFRSAHDVELTLGPLTALVGAAGSGKSNLLAAIWKLVDPGRPNLEPADATIGGADEVAIEARLHDGAHRALEASPRRAGPAARTAGDLPHALFLPAAERGARLLPCGLADATLDRALAGNAAPAPALLEAVRAWLEQGRRDVLLLIEEPELFLGPHGQRSLYRLLRDFAAAGNQVVYSTHASTFLNVGRLEELALLHRDGSGATHVHRPRPLPAGDLFRTVSEFDAERSELFLSRASILVEGRTEKLVFPFLFRALGYEADDEAISIVDCGGKPNLPVIAEVCNLIGLPYLVVHDRDAPPGRQPIESERELNAAIRSVAGKRRTVELARDFEAVAQLHASRHKPEQALERFAAADPEVPEQLADVVRRAVALARTG